MLQIICRGSSGGKYVDEPRNVSTAKWKALRTQAPLAKSAANSQKSNIYGLNGFHQHKRKNVVFSLKNGF